MKKNSKYIILTNGYILTMNNKREILEDGTIIIKGEEIEDIGTTRELMKKYDSKNTMDLKGALVHPGLIDAHEHTSMHLIRSWLPDHFSEQEMFDIFEKPYFDKVTAEDEHYGTILACIEMVLNGTTTFGDTGGATTGKPDNLIEAVKKVGIRGRVGYAIGDMMDHMPKLNSTTEKCLEKLEYQISKFPTKPEDMVGCWVGMMGMGECSDTLLVEGKKLADKYNTIFNMHQSCFKFEVDSYIKKNNGQLPINHLYKLGILGPETSLVHMIYLTPAEVEIIKKTGTCVIHCPGASTRNAMSSSIYGSFPEMVKMGVPVALGSDQGNSSDGIDIFRMAYLTAILHKEARTTTPVISAEQAFEMATINGAKVMGMDSIIGSLEVGKKADIVIHNRDHPESHPFFDPLNNLIFSVHSKSVDTVLINGKVIVENGVLKTIDTGEFFSEIDKKAIELSKRINFKPGNNWPVIER